MTSRINPSMRSEITKLSTSRRACSMELAALNSLTDSIGSKLISSEYFISTYSLNRVGRLVRVSPVARAEDNSVFEYAFVEVLSPGTAEPRPIPVHLARPGGNPGQGPT